MVMENRPEWGRNPNHTCDELCDLWEQEQQAREAWRREIDQAIAKTVGQDE